jgi:hypothetical protein
MLSRDTARVLRCSAVGIFSGATTALALMILYAKGENGDPFIVLLTYAMSNPGAWLGAALGGIIGAGACGMTALQQRGLR